VAKNVQMNRKKVHSTPV